MKKARPAEMSDAAEWDQDVLDLLLQKTRELKFDWSAVAESLRQYSDTEKEEAAVPIITPAECRKRYAHEYSRKITSVDGIIRNADPTPIAQTNEQIFQTYNEMSLEDLILHVKQKEIDMNTRKEQIFQRVLMSLGTSTEGAVLQNEGEINEVKAKYYENLQNKEIDRLNNLQIQQEQQEKQALEEERMKLKQRFLPESEDNVGENPFALSPWLHHQPVGSQTPGQSTDGSQDKAYQHSMVAATNPNIFVANTLAGLVSASTAAAAAVSDGGNVESGIIETNLEAVLAVSGGGVDGGAAANNDLSYFDTILSELEKELDENAQDKDAYIPSSELSEVLSVLETAAAAASTRAKKVTHSLDTPSAVRDTASVGSSGGNTESSAMSSGIVIISSHEYLKVFRDDETESIVPQRLQQQTMSSSVASHVPSVTPPLPTVTAEAGVAVEVAQNTSLGRDTDVSGVSSQSSSVHPAVVSEAAVNGYGQGAAAAYRDRVISGRMTKDLNNSHNNSNMNDSDSGADTDDSAEEWSRNRHSHKHRVASQLLAVNSGSKANPLLAQQQQQQQQQHDEVVISESASQSKSLSSIPDSTAESASQVQIEDVEPTVLLEPAVVITTGSILSSSVSSLSSSSWTAPINDESSSVNVVTPATSAGTATVTTVKRVKGRVGGIMSGARVKPAVVVAAAAAGAGAATE